MKCIYCDKAVFGHGGLTVPSQGPAHTPCYQANQALKRTFQSLDITQLIDQELFELKELVITEENSRKREEYEDIELF